MPEYNKEFKEKAFQAIADFSPDALIVCDGASNIVFANKQVHPLLGYNGSELLGKNFELMIPEDLREKHAIFYAQFSKNPQARPMGLGRKTYGLHKNGNVLLLEISLNAMKTGDGLFTFAAMRSVDEFKPTEPFSVDSTSFPDQNPQPVLRVDRHGKVIYENKIARLLFSKQKSKKRIYQTLSLKRYQKHF